MGEWSRTVGNTGENIVAKLLTAFGWSDHQSNLPVPCAFPKEHAIPPSDNRTTHGIDFLFNYFSPLCDDLLDTLVVSSRFSAADYPLSPGTLFKTHFGDLSATLNCYQRSALRTEQLHAFRSTRIRRTIGVLFWLNSKEPMSEVISKVSNSILNPVDESYPPIHVVDNHRASFLYDALYFARADTAGDEVTFAYINTGKVINPALHAPSGTIMPIEYLNLGLLPLRLEDSNTGTTRLMLCTADSFSGETFGRLVGFAQGLSQNWASKIDVCFPDFDPLQHSATVQLIKNAFIDKKTTQQLTVRCFRPNAVRKLGMDFG